MNMSRWSMICVVAIVALVCTFLMAAAKPPSKEVKQGEYLVKGMGCGDCHTPMKMGPNGPEPDMALFLSGHPEKLVMPPAPKLPEGPWMGIFSATMTAWAGPWGASFTANLTPDKDTGLGVWTAKNFIDTIRTGRLMGKGRQVQPPMPYQAFQLMKDADLQAMFAYLQTIPRIVNKVPDPIPPQNMGAH